MEENNKYLVRYIQRNYGGCCGNSSNIVIQHYVNNVAQVPCPNGRHMRNIRIPEERLETILQEERLIEFLEKNRIINGGEEI